GRAGGGRLALGSGAIVREGAAANRRCLPRVHQVGGWAEALHASPRATLRGRRPRSPSGHGWWGLSQEPFLALDVLRPTADRSHPRRRRARGQGLDFRRAPSRCQADRCLPRRKARWKTWPVEARRTALAASRVALVWHGRARSDEPRPRLAGRDWRFRPPATGIE